MPRLGPINRKELIRYARELGFDGPCSGGRHQFMVRGDRTLVLPNPHRGDIGTGYLTRILRQAGIEKSEWEKM